MNACKEIFHITATERSDTLNTKSSGTCRIINRYVNGIVPHYHQMQNLREVLTAKLRPSHKELMIFLCELLDFLQDFGIQSSQKH